MADLTDLEITKLCAEVMGYKLVPLNRRGERTKSAKPYELLIENLLQTYCPLINREQALDLLMKLRLDIWWDGNEVIIEHTENRVAVRNTDPLRAICECVAKVQLTKEKNNA